jgi:hypothetical protein
MVQYFPVITGSLTVQGNVLITGSINTTAGITGSFSGTATTALTASSVSNLNQNVVVTGSLTTTGQIVAQTLNVQQVTSSIVFSSGSNVFGNQLTNTQQMTGSVSVTGSFNVVTTGTELQVGSTGVTLGNALTDVHQVTGSLRVTGSITQTGTLNQTGTTSQILQTTANSVAGDNVAVLYNSNTNSYGLYIGAGSGSNHAFYCTDYTRTANLFKVQGNGNVGIGTGSPIGPLDIAVPAVGSAIGATNAQQAYNFSRLRIKHYTDSNLGLSIGYAGANYTYIQACYNEGSIAPLLLNPFGGNIGIGTGTSSPAQKLHVDSTTGDGVYISSFQTTTGAADTGPVLAFAFNDGSSNRDAVYIKGSKENSTVGNFASYMSFFTRPAGGSPTERMRITSTGEFQVKGPGTLLLDGSSNNLIRSAGNSNLSLYASNNGGSGTGEIYLYTKDIERMRITSGGTLYFNSANATAYVHINLGTSLDGGVVYQRNNSNRWQQTLQTSGDHLIFYSYTYNNTTVQFNTNGSVYNATGTYGTISSDRRLKENIVSATPKLDDLLKLNVVNFNLIDREEKYIGFIAQEMQEVFPSLVYQQDTRKYDDEGNVISGLEDSLGIKVGMEFAILVKAIQELSAKVDQQQAEIEALKAK